MSLSVTSSMEFIHLFSRYKVMMQRVKKHKDLNSMQGLANKEIKSARALPLQVASSVKERLAVFFPLRS